MKTTRKIGVYTRFFEYANFRLPLSTFLVDVLRDPLPKSTKFNVDDYAALVAQSAPFRKFSEPFLCLVGMSCYYTLDEDTYPRDGFRAEGERKLLDSTIRRVVPLLPITPARSESDLEASVDKLFDEGGNTDQGDSAAGSSHHAEIEPVTVAEDIAVVTAGRPKRQCKKRPTVTDASGSSHPPKKLRGGHGTSSGVATGGKSLSVLKELLASSILNVEGGDPTNSVTGTNLHTIGSSEIIYSDSSHRSSTNAAEVEVDTFIRSAVPLLAMTEAVIVEHK
ncbi:hypothetical protein Tco_0332480 [Tanacetum coccineum]